ncbi:MAG: hypothetical protein MI974_25370 [Chitinophagales bacterium]|nr:hypothetical protein [Chitinophagales bacterium]
MKLLLQFEWYYHLRQKAFMGLSLLFFVLGIALGSQGMAPAQIDFNAPYQMNYNIGVMTLGSVFIIMFFAIQGIIRDSAYQMEALIFSTPIQKRTFFVSRFLGVFMMSLLAFSSVFLGYALGTFSPTLDPDRLADFQILPYVWIWLTFVLPNIFVCSALIFSVSALSKNNIATYISAVLIYVFYFLSSLVFNSPVMANSVALTTEGMAWAALLDPFGLAAFFEQTQFWTPFEKNNQLIALSDYFLWNRICWIAVGGATLWLAYQKFHFQKKHKKRIAKKADFTVSPVAIDFIIPEKEAAHSFKSQWNSFVSLLKIEWRQLFRSLPYVAVLILWTVIIVTELNVRIFHSGRYGEVLYPASYLLTTTLEQPLLLLGVLLLIFYGGEMVWKEKNYQMDELIYSSPTLNPIFFFSKMIALILLPMSLILLGLILSISTQLLLGYTSIDWELYASQFYYIGIRMIVYALFILFVQQLVPNKYVGMGISLIVIILLGSSIAANIGIYHPMLRFGYVPGLSITEMVKSSPQKGAFHAYSWYWLSLNVLLTFVAFKIWQRGKETGFALKVRQFKKQWNKRQLALMFLFVLAIGSSVAFVFYHEDNFSTYQTPQDSYDLAEAYERNFKQYERLGVYFPSRVKTEVSLFPHQNAFEIDAQYWLKNRTSKVLDSLLITERLPLEKIEIDGANLIYKDEKQGVYLFEFEHSIAPQDEFLLTYKLEHTPQNYREKDYVVRNGTYLRHQDVEPFFGYRESLEIQNDFERKKRSLPPLEEQEELDEHIHATSQIGRVDFETTVSTISGQQVLTVGECLNTWEEDKRSYFHYQTPQVILPAIAYLSAAYDSKHAMHKDIEIRQFYHPGHAANVQTMEDLAIKTLDYCEANYGDYPLSSLTIAEVPGYWNFAGFAHTGLICMNEEEMYIMDQEASNFNVIAKRTIHEVAHQWWGHQLAPMREEGASFLVEGITQYIEALLMEKHFGKPARYQLSRSAHSRYFTGRAYAQEKEAPLYLVEGNQAYLSYGKSQIVMMALRDLIGEEALNKILRQLMMECSGASDFMATTTYFLDLVFQHTPVEYHSLIEDWFQKVIRYDLSITNTQVERLDDGKYQASITIEAHRWQTNDAGGEYEILMDELITIGAFSTEVETANDEDIMYLKSHQLKNGENIVHIELSERPQVIRIDPYGTRIDKVLGDN